MLLSIPFPFLAKLQFSPSYSTLKGGKNMAQHTQSKKMQKTLSKDAQTPTLPTYTNGFGYWHLMVQQARLAQATKTITNNIEQKA